MMLFGNRQQYWREMRIIVVHVDGILVPSTPVPADFFCHRTKGGNNSHRSGKTGNLLKIPYITNSLVSFYTGQCISPVCLNTVCTPQFLQPNLSIIPAGSPPKKIHPRGNPAIARSIPAAFPQHSDPYPRQTRGFRGIPAVPIPVHTSTMHTTRRTTGLLVLAVWACGFL